MNNHLHEYNIEGYGITTLNYGIILKHSSDFETGKRGFYDIQPQTIEINSGSFTSLSSGNNFRSVHVKQEENSVFLSCGCKSTTTKLCEYQVQLLQNIIDRPELRIFFDTKLRHEKIKEVAKDYGFGEESNPDDFFRLEYNDKSVEIKPIVKELFPVNQATNAYLKEHLLPQKGIQLPPSNTQKEHLKMIVVFGKHKYYDHFFIELLEAQTSKDGKIKNPLTSLNPLNLIFELEKIEELKFYNGISKFQNNYNVGKADYDIQALKALVKNPLRLDFFYHNGNISEKITANSIVPVELKTLHVDVNLSVDFKENFHEVSGKLVVDDKSYNLKDLQVKYDYFIQIKNVMYLIDDVDFLRVIDFFKQNNHKILIHPSKFEEFQQNILSKLEHKVQIRYSHVRPATKSQIVENGFDRAIGKLIYLSDSEDFVLITPVLRYGNIEIPILSKKQIYDMDANGNAFTLDRNEEAEVQFTAALLRQHPDFYEQQFHGESFYLHKNRFLSDGWFLEVFEEWENEGITILGFNDLKNNNLNPSKGTVSISVASGIDWFETSLKVQFGNQSVSLKHLHKSIRNKSKFVQLGDGTIGILPEKWIEKFSEYFNSGDIIEDKIRTTKNNFLSIAELYDEEMLTKDVKEQLAIYKYAFSRFQSIQEVNIPETLQATLRDYQKQGLNWLNFLDEFGFGGCLADDMGLGKTIQIIAFILSQRNKQQHNTNLIVVPTSLIFNWQAEVEKFAPSIKILTIHGANRVKNTQSFNQYEIILTTYGTVLSDIHFLKEYRFNYVILDESQAIKNPESQRYKSVCLLQSRNKIVLTGTPIENNTFDLYGQLSFACPGLLGTKKYFKDHYSTPIDIFEYTKRAIELQKKINPFILRRTKKQVATELPEKTEMVIYCEMGTEQQKIYDSYETEFREFISSKNEEEITKSSMHVLKGITKLRQICNSPALLRAEDEYYGDYSSKIETLMEQVENNAPQHKILIFSQFVSMLDLIKKELETRKIGFEYLTGQTKNRASKVEEFQNNDHVRVFLISLKAGGTGLNLTEADYVYLIDPWWNPSVENQAIDRSYRIGQTKNVVAVRLICPGTIEEKIMKLQESKKELANDLIKTDVSILKLLSKKDLLSLI